MTEIKTAVAGKLPTDGGNGLEAIALELAKDPLRKRVAIVLYDAPSKTEDAEKGTTTVKVRIRRFEPVRDKADRDILHEVMVRADTARLGDEAAITLAGDLEDVFGENDGVAWKDGEYSLLKDGAGLLTGDGSEVSGPEFGVDESRGSVAWAAMGTTRDAHPLFIGDENDEAQVRAYLNSVGWPDPELIGDLDRDMLASWFGHYGDTAVTEAEIDASGIQHVDRFHERKHDLTADGYLVKSGRGKNTEWRLTDGAIHALGLTTTPDDEDPADQFTETEAAAGDDDTLFSEA